MTVREPADPQPAGLTFIMLSGVALMLAPSSLAACFGRPA
jgi:hypothetical protein